VLGYSLAPRLEEAMNCRRTRERARYWVKAAKINRLAAEKRYTIPASNDWRTSVLIVQRAFPGTAHVLLSCSSAEGGHGRWGIFGGAPYYPGAEYAQTFHGDMVGGPMQYMWDTFRGHYRRGLDSLRERAISAGFEFLSMLIEDRLRETGPPWLRSAAILEQIDNYLRSGARFAYLQVALQPVVEPTSPALIEK
jgi:hypothetical protein